MKNQHWKTMSVLAAIAAAGVFCPTSASAQQTGPSASAAADSSGIYDLSQLTQAPTPKVRVAPKYPAELRAKGVKGEAVVEFVVTAQGTVSGATVVKCTEPRFGEAAVESVNQWRFRPGTKDGGPVATRMQMPVVFTLNSDD